MSKIKNQKSNLALTSANEVYKKDMIIFKADYFYLNQTYNKIESDEMRVV